MSIRTKINAILNRLLRRKAVDIIAKKQSRIERVVTTESQAIDAAVSAEKTALRALIDATLRRAQALGDTGVLSEADASNLGNVRLSLAASVGAI